jgi:PEP-CTERM motif-containing protein
MSRNLFALTTLLLVTALSPSTARADPIFITSGTLTVTGAFGGPHFTLSGDNFFASGGGEKGASSPQTSCFVCTTGSFITVNGVFLGSSLGGGLSIINGVERSGGFAGSFILTGPPVEIPFSLSNLTITSPFVFSGTLIGCPQDCALGPTIFSVTLIGGGTASVDLIFSGLFNGKPGFAFSKVTYNFEVPEPTAILLLGGGLLALGAKVRKTMRR